ncbi:hypothetical protein [Phenylobacterium montanum]|uniref:hypothetical protein n=1 Tax=Phenylobacterium montanum TaxID=2823693 RepID=UPI0020126AC0|nr:hypothetical protein [Caulobacter sp. S6]
MGFIAAGAAAIAWCGAAGLTAMLCTISAMPIAATAETAMMMIRDAPIGRPFSNPDRIRREGPNLIDAHDLRR